MQSPPQAKRYAAQILRADFGPVVEKVGSQLLVHGPASLSELGRTLSLPPTLLKNALLVLIQQNIVQCEARGSASEGRASGRGHLVQYEALLDQILVRPWFAQMLLHCNSLFRESEGDAGLLLQQLFICGRLGTEQMLQRAAAKFAHENGLEEGDKVVASKRLALHAAASQLQIRHFIVHAATLPSCLIDEGNASAKESLPAPPPLISIPSAGPGRKRKAPAAGRAGSAAVAPPPALAAGAAR
jgi:hypothetical protein